MVTEGPGVGRGWENIITPVQLQRKLKQKQLEGAFSHKLPKHLESHISESGWGEKEETVSLGAHICYPLKKISEKWLFFM